jgi:hypothetical protein
LQETTGNHWFEYIELKMTIWSTYGDCNIVSHDLKHMDSNSQSHWETI